MDVSSGGGRGRGVCIAEALRPVTVEKVPRWCEAAERGLCETFGCERELIVAGVERGTLELWRLWHGEAWSVTRIDAGVITCCCYQGVDLAAWAGWLMDRARRMQLRSVLFYTAKPGVARIVRRFGFVPQETVYRADL